MGELIAPTSLILQDNQNGVLSDGSIFHHLNAPTTGVQLRIIR